MYSVDVLYNDDEIREKFSGEEVILFGAGKCGELFLKKFPNINVVIFVDSKKAGSQINDIRITAIDELKKLKEKRKIIITSSKFACEIIKTLYKMNFNKEDLCVWDPLDFSDENIENFIKHNEKIWFNYNCGKVKNKILIPYERVIDVSFVNLAYVSNYLSRKYNAEILGYARYDYNGKLYLGPIARIYRSINLKGIIDVELNEKQKTRVNKLLDAVWPTIQTQRDWKRIKIYDIDFGTSIIRDFYRFNMPSFNPRSDYLKKYLRNTIEIIVFWYDYFKRNNDVKCVILWDGVCRESFLRDIAIFFGLPVYAVHYSAAYKCKLDHHFGNEFKYYRKFYNELSEKEQQYGIKWAKRKLEARFNGDKSEISYMQTSVYEIKEKMPVLEKNDKIKVMICPHTFQDDVYGYGWQIFSSVFEWLCYLGEVSNKTNYDWYLKPHPSSDARDDEIIAMLLERYRNIKILPKLISPQQLKKEGMQFALTVWGTIGHEYPALGIQVINAGNNPHIAFDFDWNPRNKREFDDLIFNLSKLKNDVDIIEIYKFYCIHYLYYKSSIRERQNVFFSKPEDFYTPITSEDYKSERLKKYLDSWKEKDHEVMMGKTRDLFYEMDQYKDNIFYKNRVSFDDCKEE